jgi:hypothetical protein
MAMNAVTYLFAGLRWRHVISREAALTRRTAFDVVAIGNLVNLVAPSRAGDLARAALVARRRDVPVSRVLGGLAVERYADVVMLIALAAGLWSTVRFPTVIATGVFAFAAAGVLALAAAVFAAGWLPAFAGRMAGLAVPSLEDRIRGFLDGIFAGARRAGHLDMFGPTLGFSVAVWASAGLAMLCNQFAFQLPVPWYSAFFVMLVVNLGGVIPASPGSIGLYHYLTITALSVWMSDSSRALGYAVVAHAAGLVVVTLLGLLALAGEGESLFHVERVSDQALESLNGNEIA